jgi:uncharacterized protein
MVHMFRCAGLNLLLDVESGALHVLSDQARRVAARYLGGMNGRDIEQDLPDIDADTVRECVAQLRALEDSGLCSTPEDDALPIDEGAVVKALCLHVAHDCNLRCGYCFASTGDFDGARSLMPFEVGRDALDFLIANSGGREHLEVDFFGGEPMMNFPVVRRIVEYGRALEKQHAKTIHFTMTTNAYALPEGAAAFCDAQMHNLVLSIDGRQAVHDAVRPNAGGGPSHARALANAKTLIAHRGDKEYYARGTFTRRNTDFVPDVEALWDEGFAHVSVEPVVLPPEHPLSLREADLPAVLRSYDELLQAVLRRKRLGKPHHFFHFMVDLSGGPCLKKRLSGCGAGREYLAVTPEGALYPCHQFVGREGFEMGNVRDGVTRPDIRDAFAQNHVRNKGACASCFAKYYCSGGCAANAHAYGDSLLTPNPIECAMLKKRTECALALAALACEPD